MPLGHGPYPLNDATSPAPAEPDHLDQTPPETVNPQALTRDLSLVGILPSSQLPRYQDSPENGRVHDWEMEVDGFALSNGEYENRHENSGGVKRTRPNPLPISSLKTGLCYDVRMRYHATVDAEDMHPEDPRRIYEIYKALCQAGLVDDPEFTGVKRKGDLMLRIDAREVTMEEALLVHTDDHWKFLDSTQGRKLSSVAAC